MNPTTVAILMLIVVIGCILWNKIPLNFVLFVVPFVSFFLLGYNVQETSKFILAQFNTVMSASGYMLLFGLIYFNMLSETGLFTIILNKVIDLLGSKLNVIVIMVLTSIISAIAFLTANISTTYLIVFPIMIPLFNRYKINREYAYIIAQTALAAMCWLPWGIGVVNSSIMAGTNPETLAKGAMPWGLCFIPAIILQWIYFAFAHKKKYKTWGLPQQAGETTTEEKKEENPNARPKLLWFNLIVFLLVIVALAYLKIPSYLVFIIASIITALVNYPKDFNVIWNKAGTSFFNVLIMLLAICFFLSAFNAAPEDGSKLSMVKSLAETMIGIFPAPLMKYIHIIFLLLAVPIIHFIPNQVYTTMYPIFISIGATFGLSSIDVISPFVCNLALATSVTLLNPATYVGATLSDVEVKHFTNYGGVVMFVTNIVVVITALVSGVLVL